MQWPHADFFANVLAAVDLTVKSGRTAVRLVVQFVARCAVSSGAAETKSQVGYNLGQNLYSSSSASFPINNQFAVGPNSSTCQIAQGVQQGARIGNKITTKSLYLKGTIRPTGYNSTTNPAVVPLQVRLVVYYDRQEPNMPPAPASDFFQLGNANQGFVNDLADLWRPYNTDRYRILTTRTFKIGYSSATATGGVTALMYTANNDFKLNANFRLNLTKYYPKNVKFDENNLQPMTRSLFVLFYCCAATGDPYGSSVIPAAIEYSFEYKYTDM